MIDVRELRIGNIVHANDVNEQRLVEKTIDCSTDIDNTEWFFPIELTEEYLLKFGFIQVMEGSLKFDEYRKGLITLCAVGGNVHKFQLMLHGNCLPIFIDYVHTLQNICYYLGQELTFKETLNG